MADYNEQKAQLQLDLEELKHLQSIAKRPRILSLLSSEIYSVDSKVATL
jgi:Siah interacting protein, N terminal